MGVHCALCAQLAKRESGTDSQYLFTEFLRGKSDSLFCLACHSLQNAKLLGPDLYGVGAIRSRSFIESRIANGAIVMHGGSQYKSSRYSMPPTKLSQQEIKRITDFPMTLPEN